MEERKKMKKKDGFSLMKYWVNLELKTTRKEKKRKQHFIDISINEFYFSKFWSVNFYNADFKNLSLNIIRYFFFFFFVFSVLKIKLLPESLLGILPLFTFRSYFLFFHLFPSPLLDIIRNKDLHLIRII